MNPERRQDEMQLIADDIERVRGEYADHLDGIMEALQWSWTRRPWGKPRHPDSAEVSGPDSAEVSGRVPDSAGYVEWLCTQLRYGRGGYVRGAAITAEIMGALTRFPAGWTRP